tara:strand:- start:61 stop:2412 length:2352 start_codon:yes stop_codon:yes gene_type:complete
MTSKAHAISTGLVLASLAGTAQAQAIGEPIAHLQNQEHTHWGCGTPDNTNQRGTWVDSLWTDGIVPYEFAPDINPTERAGFLNGIAMVESACGVQFVPRSGETSFIHVGRSATTGVSFSSAIGQTGVQQNITIWDSHWGWTGLIAHELMHALGLHHEQKRPDRDSYIVINYGNIDPVYHSQFNIAANAIAHGPYDFESIMHYDDCAFNTCASGCSFPTCTSIWVPPPNDGFQNVIGQLNALSEGDKAVLTMMYGPALAPNADNRSGSVSARVGNPDAVEDFYNVDPSDEYALIDRDLIVNATEGPDEFATAKVLTRSEYVGYEPGDAFRFDSIEFVSEISARMFVGFETGTVSAQENISMGFTIDHLDPGETVDVLLAAMVKTTGDVNDARILFSGPFGTMVIDSEYNHIMPLGNGEYTLRGIADIAFSASGDFLGEGSVELTASLGSPTEIDQPSVLAGPFMSEITGNAYYLLEDGTWEDAQRTGVSALGGDLVTVNDADENSFVRFNVAQFDDAIRHTWLGLTDRFDEGIFSWVSDEMNPYTAFLSGEPDGNTGENHVAMFRGTSGWFDAQNDWNESFAPVHGVIEVEIPDILAGPFYHNGHTYYLLEDANWYEANAAAKAMSGDLVTINDAAENTFVRFDVAQFDGEIRHTWLGLADQSSEGTFNWNDGDPSAYRTWISNEPNGGIGENFVAMFRGSSGWFDAQHDWNERFAPVHGVVEIPVGAPCPADLTGDGQLDFFDVSAFLSAFTAMDPVADFSGDGILNFFDVSAFLGLYTGGCP